MSSAGKRTLSERKPKDEPNRWNLTIYRKQKPRQTKRHAA